MSSKSTPHLPLAGAAAVDEFPDDRHIEILAGIMMALSRAVHTTTDDEGFVNDRVRPRRRGRGLRPLLRRKTTATNAVLLGRPTIRPATTFAPG